MSLSIKEYAEVLEEIEKFHGWNNLWQNHEEGRKVAKYVDTEIHTCVNTRGDSFDDKQICIWSVSFRQITGSKLPNDTKYEAIVFQDSRCNKETILEWLNSN